MSKQRRYILEQSPEKHWTVIPVNEAGEETPWSGAGFFHKKDAQEYAEKWGRIIEERRLLEWPGDYSRKHGTQ